MSIDFETALLIIPPPPIQAFCYPLREEFDKESFGRVPAHITLLYPFVPPDAVDDAEEKLQVLCADIAPFDVSLKSYGRFETTIFLEPADPTPIVDLYKRLTEAFPDFPIYDGEHGQDLTPHLTLARGDDPTMLAGIELPSDPDFTFNVSKIHIYLGSPEDDIPYVPRSVIPLGGK